MRVRKHRIATLTIYQIFYFKYRPFDCGLGVADFGFKGKEHKVKGREQGVRGSRNWAWGIGHGAWDSGPKKISGGLESDITFEVRGYLN